MMKRRDFLQKNLLSGALIGTSLIGAGAATGSSSSTDMFDGPILNSGIGDPDELVIEREVSGKPHIGKVLLCVQAHSDDITLMAGGTVAKLLDEGYTGYLLRCSDDSRGNGDPIGNLEYTINIAKGYGMKRHIILCTHITGWMPYRSRISKVG